MNILLHFFHFKRIISITKIKYFIAGFKNYAVFRGKANRSEFWYFMLYWFICYMLLVLVENTFGWNYIDMSNYKFSKYIHLLQYSNKVGILTILYRPITFLPSLSVSVRRLHDSGVNGWWSLLFFTPFGILLLIPLIKKGNEKNSNDVDKK